MIVKAEWDRCGASSSKLGDSWSSRPRQSARVAPRTARAAQPVVAGLPRQGAQLFLQPGRDLRRQPTERGDPQVVHFQPTSDSRVTKRMTELATRKMYLTNFWYAVGFSGNTEAGPVYRTKLLDMHVAFWRDGSGAVRCTTDTDPVTGGRLSDGRPCTAPTTGSAPHPAIRSACGRRTFDAVTGQMVGCDGDSGARLEVWDCHERGGFIWLYFGAAATPMKKRPPIPWVPELSKPGWRGVHGEVTIRGNHWMVMENVIDMAHVPYVHKGTVGDHAAFVDIVIKETPTSLNFSFPIENHHSDGEKPALRVDTIATACLPSTSFIRFTLPRDIRLVTINSIVPIDEETTTIRFCQMRNFLQLPLIDPVIRQGMRNILGEDKVIIEMLKPDEVTTEVSLAADSPQMAFRKMRERYIAAGAAVAPGSRPLHSLPDVEPLSNAAS